MYERILVPTDGSDCAAEAVDHALEIAAHYGAAVDALFVSDRRSVEYSAPAISAEAVERALEDHGESVTADVTARGRERGVEVTPVVKAGSPATVIREYAEAHGVDLVVMSTHGRSGLERHLLGSVTERTVRRSPVPVLTVNCETDE